MPRKSKSIQKEKVTPRKNAARENEAAVPQPRKKRAVKARTGKDVVVTKRAVPKAQSPATDRVPSEHEIRLRAYFLAERRVRLYLPGDINGDWLEAQRQLVAETRGSTC